MRGAELARVKRIANIPQHPMATLRLIRRVPHLDHLDDSSLHTSTVPQLNCHLCPSFINLVRYGPNNGGQ